MILNIPCRSNPMPYYVNNKGPDYENMPLTFEPISSNTSVRLTRNSSSDTKVFYYKTNSMSNWAQYTFDTEINLNVGDTCSFSGDATVFHPAEKSSQINHYKFYGSSSGQLKAYGNIHSLIAYSNLTNYGFRNLFRGQQYISDYSGVFLPVPSSNAVSGLYGSAWRDDSYVKKLPVMRITDWSKNIGNTLDAAGYSSNKISLVEVCWTSWPSDGSAVTYFLYGANSNSTSIYIKPQALSLVRMSGTNGRIPNGWTVLNRMSDGSLQFAQTTTWNGVSYSAGAAFPDADPYAWYYN